jgi:hypothetical protein
VAGRTEDSFWIETPEGYRELPGYAFLLGMIQCLELGEFQVVQTARNEFTLRAAAVPGKTINTDRFTGQMRDSLRLSGYDSLLKLDIQVVPEIRPDPRTGKMRHWLSDVGRPSELPEPEAAID